MDRRKTPIGSVFKKCWSNVFLHDPIATINPISRKKIFGILKYFNQPEDSLNAIEHDFEK